MKVEKIISFSLNVLLMKKALAENVSAFFVADRNEV
jgi:hypothetical protein